MPGIDGYEVCRRLKSENKLGAIRVIAVSGYGSEEARARSREAGCDLHLAKPVNLRELMKAVDGSFPGER